MIRHCFSVAAAVLLVAGAAQSAFAQAFDSVFTADNNTVRGKVTSVSPTAVTVTVAGVDKEIAVNEIRRVAYAGQTELTQATVNASNGAFENAKEQLEKIDLADVNNAFAKTDIEYYKAYCDVRLALAGAGDLAAAKDELLKFVKANPKTYHFYESAELLGDLSVAMKTYPEAVKYYGALTGAPWPDYKARAAVLLGRTLQAQGNNQAAAAKFDEALAVSGNSDEIKRQHLAATLGKAVSLAANEAGVPQAIEMVTTVIKQGNPEDTDLHARAYNALGLCHRTAGNVKDAILAYLHVDLLYNGSPEAHAEALAALSDLWAQIGKNDRAGEAGRLLRDRYPQSKWASQ